MNNAFQIIKIIGAWGFLIGAVISLVLLRADPLALDLAVISLGFSQAPIG